MKLILPEAELCPNHIRAGIGIYLDYARHRFHQNILPHPELPFRQFRPLPRRGKAKIPSEEAAPLKIEGIQHPKGKSSPCGTVQCYPGI